MPKTEHGVYIHYGVMKFKLTANELQLIADALEIINPDTEKQTLVARRLSSAFLALSEYAESVKRA